MEKERIIGLYNDGYNIEDISDETGLDETKIFEILEEEGLL